MQNKIAIVTTGHFPFDERIYWKFALSLTAGGNEVQIICSTEDIDKEVSGIYIKGFSAVNITKKEKNSRLSKLIFNASPNIIICCEPFAVLPAFKYKKSYNKNCRIISDITEWYPENVTSKINLLKRFPVYIILTLLNILLVNISDALIIGEITKKKRYDIISPFKKKIIIGYYPVLKYFNYQQPKFNGKELTLCYAGLVSFQRGILALLDSAVILAKRHPEMYITIQIIGRFQSEKEEAEFNNITKRTRGITVEMLGWTEYTNISNMLKEADICFDLRERNFIYNNSLPIKIFEYMAAGKPFLFSDVLPIRKELGKINCGFLVDPDDEEEIADTIEKYISSPTLLKEHSENGRAIIEHGKNWESEAERLFVFLEQINE